MGLRLKTQLTALFLFLFGFSFVCLAYFNLSILTTAVHSKAVEQSRSMAVQVEDWLTREIPRSQGMQDLDEVALQHPTSLVHYLERLQDLNSLEVYSRYGNPPTRLFRYGQAQLEQAPHEASVRRALEGERFYRLWEYDSRTDEKGHAVQDVSPFSSGRVLFEYYAPIRRLPEHEGDLESGGLEGIIHVSLMLPNTPLRIRVAVIGNVVLGAVFIFTGFLSLNLWAQHAVKRPLDGLMRARERLGKGYGDSEVEDMLSANELVAVSNSLNRLSLDLSKYQGELEEKTRRLEQANERYKQLNEGLEQQVLDKTRELREFFSLVTHDLRIPLAATQGYADLLTRGKSGDLNEKQRKFVKSIRTANSHALELVRNLLDAMRYESGQTGDLVLETFDFHELVQEVVSHLDIPDDEGHSEPIEMEVPDVVLVTADRTRIGRVLGNLVGNALRHIAPGQQVKLTAQLDGPNLRVDVADNGPGIPAEHLPLLFEKFTHFPSEKGPSSGLGLGLYIVRRILESHGESIHVESRVGEGSRFWFHLPVTEDDDA